VLLQAAHPAHAVYNAPCESIVVADLKREVEALNSNIKVRLSEGLASGNPRLLNSDRFRMEFDFTMASIAEQLRRAAAQF